MSQVKLPPVKICDVTLRDGLQALDLDARLPFELRPRLFDALQRAHLPYTEVGSFVNPRVMPSMESTPKLLAMINPGPTETAVLVPTMKYYQRAKVCPNISTVALLLSASEGYSKLNTRMNSDQAMASALGVTAAALKDGYRVRGYLSYAFRDYGEGNQPQDTGNVVRVCEQLLDAGCEMVAIADTNGTATPSDIERILGAFRQTIGVDKIGVHLHDRYGLGITNCYVAFQNGVTIFDSAIGGIGGNRMVKGSVSNVSTEELVFMFHAIGVDTGTNFDALLEAGRIVEEMIDLLKAPPSQSKILLNRVDALPQ